MESSSGLVQQIAKTAVFAFPPVMASIYFPGRDHQLIFDLSLFMGTLLQALIPPWRKGLLRLLCIAVVICVVNYIFLR